MIKHGDNSFERFYRMFPVQGTRFKKELLKELAETPVYRSGRTDIPAGYTYFGQFIAHDITHMGIGKNVAGNGPVSASSIDQFATPSLDLDSVYGGELVGGINEFGYHIMADNHCFESQYKRKLNGRAVIYDIPRDELSSHISYKIGDARNDENFLTAQVHVLFMNLHNRLVELHRQNKEFDEAYKAAREESTLLYQYVIINDFLERVMNETVYENLFLKDEFQGLFGTTVGEEPRIPIEFSGAAMRFGHSMVRSEYSVMKSSRVFRLEELFQLTGPGGDWERIRRENIFLEWERQFDMTRYGMPRVFDRTRRIDTALSRPLSTLRNELPSNINLSLRNQRRGNELDLPCGQDVVNYLLSEERDYSLAMGLSLKNLEDIESWDFQNLLIKWELDRKIPLWTYILLEPWFYPSPDEHKRLGVLGSIIIGEVFKNILIGSRVSVYNKEYSLQNGVFLDYMNTEFGKDKVNADTLDMSDIIAFTYF